MRHFGAVISAVVLITAAACTGSDANADGKSVNAARGAVSQPDLKGIDGIKGWKRTGEDERYNKEALYGYIDGGAEIVLQYGFRELAVSRYKPAARGDAVNSGKEIVLEIYRMTSAEAAFGLYSIKLEGGEKAWPGIEADNWVAPGQAGLVKGDFIVNVLAPECGEKETGEFLAEVERQIPGGEPERPKEMAWLPREGMVPSSWHFIKGTLAAQSESPFLDGGFWGFATKDAADKATVACSAKYGAAPAISKLIVVRLGESVAPGTVDRGVRALFSEYLKSVQRDGSTIRGQNEAGRWFLFKMAGSVAALVLGDADEKAARARLNAASALAAGQKGPQP